MSKLPQDQDGPHLVQYVAYAVKSSPDPKDACGTQLAKIVERVEALGERAVFAGPFSEENASGYRAERGDQLAAAIDAVKRAAREHGTAELWVNASQRLARGTGHKGRARALGHLLYELRAVGVAVRSVEDDEFTTNEMLWGLASRMASKYSEDLSGWVTDGKRRQREAGDRAGGPVLDGYIERQHHDERGRRVATEYDFDGARQDTLARMWELHIAGLDDTAITRRLNAEGHRTEAGAPWRRSRVRDTLTNPFYAGRIAWYRNDPDRPTEVCDGVHPRYVEPQDFDRLMRERKGRDKAAGSNRRTQGRPNSNHLLAKLAVCGRCGSPMLCKTSSYRRKGDGGRARSYLCMDVVEQTGLCNAPVVDAEAVEPYVVAHLERYLVDFDAWIAANVEQSTGDRERITALVAAERAEQDRLTATVERMAVRYAEHVATGQDTLAMADAEAMRVATQRRDQAAHRLRELDDAQAAVSVEHSPTDAMLDLFNELASEIRGALNRGTLREVNSGLRARFDRFDMHTMADGTVAVLPVLLGGSALDGTPEGTFILHGTDDAPPSRSLTVPERNGTNSQT